MREFISRFRRTRSRPDQHEPGGSISKPAKAGGDVKRQAKVSVVGERPRTRQFKEARISIHARSRTTSAFQRHVRPQSSDIQKQEATISLHGGPAYLAPSRNLTAVHDEIARLPAAATPSPRGYEGGAIRSLLTVRSSWAFEKPMSRSRLLAREKQSRRSASFHGALMTQPPDSVDYPLWTVRRSRRSQGPHSSHRHRELAGCQKQLQGLRTVYYQAWDSYQRNRRTSEHSASKPRLRCDRIRRRPRRHRRRLSSSDAGIGKPLVNTLDLAAVITAYPP